MPISRRALMSSSLAFLAVAGLTRPIRAGAQATPDGSPVASPQAATQPSPELEAVLPAYADRRDALTALGRTAVETFLDGDDAAFMALLTPAAAEAIAAVPIATLREELETDRLSFSLAVVNAAFDARYTGAGRMDGFYTQAGTTSPFTLATDEPLAPDAPAGTWEGSIADTVPITVTFGGTPDALTATLDVPDQGIMGEPLAGVTLAPSRPIGERQAERSLPVGGAGENYAATCAWGEATLLFVVVPDGAGKVAGFTIAPRYPLPQDMATGTITGVTYRLPFDGVWFTYWGGLTELENYHAATPSQRHAYDFVVWNDGATFRDDGTRNADYHAWGQPALAPVSGTVVAVENGMPDMRPGELLSAIDPAAAQGLHPAGNHVIIRTADTAFAFVAHLQQGSVAVRNGDAVSAGDRIGLVGNSGNTSEPHVHVHLQNVADFFAPAAVSLPLRFADYLANGEPVSDGIPTQGEFVESSS